MENIKNAIEEYTSDLDVAVQKKWSFKAKINGYYVYVNISTKKETYREKITEVLNSIENDADYIAELIEEKESDDALDLAQKLTRELY